MLGLGRRGKTLFYKTLSGRAFLMAHLNRDLEKVNEQGGKYLMGKVVQAEGGPQKAGKHLVGSGNRAAATGLRRGGLVRGMRCRGL